MTEQDNNTPPSPTPPKRRGRPPAKDKAQAQAAAKAHVPETDMMAGVHMPRGWQSRDANPIRQQRQPQGWADQGLLSRVNIPAREGYDQQWKRTKLEDGKDDVSNVQRNLQEGWQPRSAASVPEAAVVPTVRDATFGEIIGYRDMVLMERPQEMSDRSREIINERTRRQTQAISADPYRDGSLGRNTRQTYEQQTVTRTGTGARQAPLDN